MERVRYGHWGARLLLASFLLLCAGAMGMRAQTCEGRVCLKNGTRLQYAGDDRMDMPSKKRDVRVYRRFFSSDCQRDVVPYDRIDSVVVWNSAAPDAVRLLVPLEGVGWSWLYAGCSRLLVYVYASQGYSLNAQGGIRAWQGNRVSALFMIPGKTACDFYVQRPGEKPVCLGDAYKKCDKAFVRKLCQAAGLTTRQEQELLREVTVNRSTMIQRVLELIGTDKSNQRDRKHDENNPTLAALAGSHRAGYAWPGTQE